MKDFRPMRRIDGLGITFDHVSIAANSVDRGIAFFQRYFPTYPRYERQASEQASGALIAQDFYLGGTAIEFIEDLPNQRGFVTDFIRRYGEGMHHICFEVNRIEPIVAALKEGGIRVVDEWSFTDGRIAFISPRAAFGTLIQFWQPVDNYNTVPRPPDDGRVRFDHLGLAVRDIRRAMEFFERHFGARVIDEPVLKASQSNCILAHLDITGVKMELLQSPGRGTRNDFVSRFIERYGEGLHHIKINVKDFDEILYKLEADGVRILDKEASLNGQRQFLISPRSAFGTLVQVSDGLDEPGQQSD